MMYQIPSDIYPGKNEEQQLMSQYRNVKICQKKMTLKKHEQ